MLVGYREVKGIIHCKTGLRIGGSKDDLEIGGVDNPIIRHPITELPYIPGSSIKGKMRSLLEQKLDKIAGGGKPHECGQCEVCLCFGAFRSASVSRFIFRDCHLTPSSEQALRDLQTEKGINMSEAKKEVIIDRKTGRARDGGLRTNERIPAGAEFAFAMSIRVLTGDPEEDYIRLLKTGIELVEKDYLGGSGTRGYGQVEFRSLSIDGSPLR